MYIEMPLLVYHNNGAKMKYMYFIVGIIMLCGPASALEVDPGVKFHTDTTDYWFTYTTTVDTITVYDNALNINGGNVTFSSSYQNEVYIDILDGTTFKFISWEVFSLTVSDEFGSIQITDSEDYGLQKTDVGDFIHTDTASIGSVTFSDIPAGTWYFEQIPAPPTTPPPDGGGGAPPPPSPTPTPEPTPETPEFPITIPDIVPDIKLDPDTGGYDITIGETHITVPEFFISPLWIIAIFMLLSLLVVGIAVEIGGKK